MAQSLGLGWGQGLSLPWTGALGQDPGPRPWDKALGQGLGLGPWDKALGQDLGSWDSTTLSLSLSLSLSLALSLSGLGPRPWVMGLHYSPGPFRSSQRNNNKNRFEFWEVEKCFNFSEILNKLETKQLSE